MDSINPPAVAPAVAPGSGMSRAQAAELAGERYEAGLNACIEGQNRGDDLVILQDNLPMLFGDQLIEHFKRTVGEALGMPVDITVMDGGDKFYTLVQIPKGAPSVQVPPAELSAIDVQAIAAGLGKAPRPMNCWIIFRDAMHKQLKAEHPELSVQEICKYTEHSSS